MHSPFWVQAVVDIQEKNALKLGEGEDAFFKIMEMIAHQQAKYQSLILFLTRIQNY